ncbi:hypothetical protein [Pontibacter sp. G13]|uniref:hypothetical protein n=1 Tax=Pontibacter sp. G13 TaxID=3074898 RepID=UPI00288AC3D6|nr:hypothetical protein [Pontibacter sp. G13]WNJ18774.1 hypothetical protein RJD25_28290 [Pontibacter sp. G13]
MQTGIQQQQQQPQTLAEVQAFAVGKWQSLSVELRPTEDRTGSGKIEPTFLRRHFDYLDTDRFKGVITLFGDPYGQLPLLEFEFRGALNWGGPHPIAAGAYEIDYVLNEKFGVTPLHDQSTEMLNAGLLNGMTPFQTNVQSDILGKAFPLFNIQEGQITTDYDLIYFHDGLLFMGAKHVDGTPFDRPDRRPQQLQIPLQRAK